MEGVQVIWLGTILGEAKPEELEQFFKEEGFTVKFNEEFEDNDGHRNIIFSLMDNIGKFCMYRLMRPDMKWLDDWHENHPTTLPEEIISKYNLTIEEEE